MSGRVTNGEASIMFVAERSVRGESFVVVAARKPEYQTETVRESSDIEPSQNPQPAQREEDALNSTDHGLRGYWTKLVRFLGSDRSMNR
jgi:hypothetical protein